MYFKNFILLYLFFVFICGSQAKFAGRKLRLPEPDKDLQAYIKNATLQAQTSFKNQIESNNVYGYRRSEFQMQMFDDNVLKIGDHRLYLSKLQIIGSPEAQLNHLNPDLLYNYMDADVLWKEVVIAGHFEFHQKRNLYSVSVVKGDLRLIWKDTKAGGIIAFLPFEHTNSFYSTNYDLSFETDKVDLSITNESKEHNIILDNTVEDLKKLLQDDLFWKLQENLRYSIDSFLETQSIDHTFSNNDVAMQRYRSYTKQTQLILNDAVDEVLKMVKGGVSESGYWKFSIPEIYLSFSKKIWFVTFWGHTRLWNGEMKDLRTLRRRTDFSFIVKDGVVELSGSADLGQLAGGYPNYDVKFIGIGPSGIVSMTVNSNAFSFKLQAEENGESTLLGYKVLSHTFKVHLENIKIDITGLGVLNWLGSIITSFVVNCFKGEISQLIENEINKTLDGMLDYIS